MPRRPHGTFAALLSLEVLVVACGRPEGSTDAGGGVGGGAGGGTAADADGDGVPDQVDADPADPAVCADADGDGCGLHRPRRERARRRRLGRGRRRRVRARPRSGVHARRERRRRSMASGSVLALRPHERRSRALRAESGGGEPIAWSEELWEIAFAHSANMCAQGDFSHVIDGDGPGQRAAKAGLGFSPWENIAVNLDPSATEYAWMNEPTCTGHRGTIVHAGAIEVGIGYYNCNRDPDTSNYLWGNHHHVTADFRVSGPESSYCSPGAPTECAIPATPPSVAVCPPQLVAWDFWPAPADEVVPGDWQECTD